MAEHPKFVLMVQPMNLQGLIWQAALRSQNLSVIWEAADVDLPDTLSHLKAKQVALPDLLLIDTRIRTFNAYTFCRWGRQHCPEVKIVLISGAQQEIAPSEREWAIYQGAAELLPRFRRDTLVSGAIIKVQRILELLECSRVHQGTLVSALLTVQKRTCRRSEFGLNGSAPVGREL